MVPSVGPLLAELTKYAEDLDRWRIAQMAESARSVVNDDKRFVQALKDDERLLDMLMEAAESSARTAWEAKRVTMGKVLGQAALDNAQVDELAVMIAALQQLEPIHFRYLATLEDSPEAPFQNLEEDMLIPEPYRSRLQATGVVSVHTRWGGNASRGGADLLGINDFGRRFLAWVRDSEDDIAARSDAAAALGAKPQQPF